MRKAKPVATPELLYLSVSIAFGLVAEGELVLAQLRDTVPLLHLELFTVLLVVSLVLTYKEIRAASGRAYAIALLGHVLMTLGMVPFSASLPAMEYLLYVIPLLGICLHNPRPVALILSLFYTLILVAERTLVQSVTGVGWDLIWTNALEYLVVCILVAGAAMLMVHYREAWVGAMAENRRMDALVDRLSKANVQYQEYAKTIEESSIDTERKRITREVHDIVGYTLTNNITMMEAITDMIHENPLGVGHMVDMARENAQDGLTRIREALYQLRRSDRLVLSGHEALRKLLRVYQHGTGVRVELHLNGLAWDFPPETHTGLYHVDQEGLINSFRHGKASQVYIFLSLQADALVLRLCDNGTGSAAVVEGIGLGGMRERLTKIGGKLRYESGEYGFTLDAVLPPGLLEGPRRES